MGNNQWQDPPILHPHWLNAFYCRTHGTCSCARACVWSLFSSFFPPSAANKPPVSDGYSPSLLLRGETFPRGRKKRRRIPILNSRNSTKEPKTVHKPGGRKGRPCFEVTMEVPGMQVSRKVDSVGLKRQIFVLCDSAAPPEVWLPAFWSKSLN